VQGEDLGHYRVAPNRGGECEGEAGDYGSYSGDEGLLLPQEIVHDCGHDPGGGGLADSGHEVEAQGGGAEWEPGEGVAQEGEERVAGRMGDAEDYGCGYQFAAVACGEGVLEGRQVERKSGYGYTQRDEDDGAG